MSEILPNHEKDTPPILKSAQPILAVSDVIESVRYWQEVLGFPGKWTWGDPPTHAGVHWGETQIQFTFNADLAATAAGRTIWINVANIESLYAQHQRSGAEILSPLETKPWGVAEYRVRENSGYEIRFAAPASDRENSLTELPEQIKIESRPPTPAEYRVLVEAVGWSGRINDSLVEVSLSSLACGVTAIDVMSGEAVGCAMAIGDGVGFYYIKDVMVLPQWQNKRVGTALMRRLREWVMANAPDNALLGLYTGEHLSGFYAQFGFIPAFGMMCSLKRNPE